MLFGHFFVAQVLTNSLRAASLPTQGRCRLFTVQTKKLLSPSITQRQASSNPERPWSTTNRSKSIIRRPPVVTIMGHVDHGKTTLLDNLRNSQIVKQEFGGITQHIGAFVVPFKNKSTNEKELVTFLDTPGHAAFASMRQRGANVTDIVVLVIACEDGVLDQTVESIRYAKNSKVPIIVAINKVDKFSNQKELEERIRTIRSQLIVQDVIPELDGGDVQLVKISALQGNGIEDLKESIMALSELLELKADISCLASGHVIESSVDPHRGKLCTILVERGQIIKGSVLLAGSSNWARTRALFDERGQLQQSCGPGLPIQVTGWRESTIPSAGDIVIEVQSETEAKSLIHRYKTEQIEHKAMNDAQQAALRYSEFYRLYKEKLIEKRESGRKYGRIFFTSRGQRPKESEVDELADRKLNIILKCDVDGSLDALLDIFDTYDKDSRQYVKLDLMHHGVGAITDSDLKLASSFKDSVIYGFNVKPANQQIFLDAKRAGIDLKLFNVIYHLIDDLKSRIAEKIPETDQEIEVGRALVLQEFIVSEEKKKKVHVAGCRCSRGILKRTNVFYKLVRNQETIVQDLQVKTMKHLKDEAKEIEKERECGISFMNTETPYEFKPGDVLICYEKHKVKPRLKWDIKGFS